MKKSWKTSAGGIALVIGAIAAAISALTDNDPATVPQWEILGAQIVAGVSLLFARDNNVTSEKAGAK